MSDCGAPRSWPRWSPIPGRLFAPERLATELRSRPKILLVHGDRDEVVLPESLLQAYAALVQAGVPVEEMLRPGLGHGIDAEGLAAGGEFLRAALTTA